MTNNEGKIGRRAARRRVRERARARRNLLLAVLGVAVVGVLAVVGFRLASDNGTRGAAMDSADTSAPAWSAQAYSGGPRLAVDRTIIDHGSVHYGHTVNAVFRLKNVGDQPLDLRPASVATLDGC